ncbi:MAG: hypothetical protein QXI60_03130 [Thermofilaceae archaeon]
MGWRNKLDELTARAALATGAEKMSLIAEVRDYLRRIPPDQVIREALQIRNPLQLRVLIAAGIPGGAWQRVMEHIADVERELGMRLRE